MNTNIIITQTLYTLCFPLTYRYMTNKDNCACFCTHSNTHMVCSNILLNIYLYIYKKKNIYKYNFTEKLDCTGYKQELDSVKNKVYNTVCVTHLKLTRIIAYSYMNKTLKT